MHDLTAIIVIVLNPLNHKLALEAAGTISRYKRRYPHIFTVQLNLDLKDSDSLSAANFESQTSSIDYNSFKKNFRNTIWKFGHLIKKGNFALFHIGTAHPHDHAKIAMAFCSAFCTTLERKLTHFFIMENNFALAQYYNGVMSNFDILVNYCLKESRQFQIQQTTSLSHYDQIKKAADPNSFYRYKRHYESANNTSFEKFINSLESGSFSVFESMKLEDRIHFLGLTSNESRMEFLSGFGLPDYIVDFEQMFQSTQFHTWKYVISVSMRNPEYRYEINPKAETLDQNFHTKITFGPINGQKYPKETEEQSFLIPRLFESLIAPDKIYDNKGSTFEFNHSYTTEKLWNPHIPKLLETYEFSKAHHSNCQICSKHFGMFLRKNNCRLCGISICSYCSFHSKEIFNLPPVLICLRCGYQ